MVDLYTQSGMCTAMDVLTVQYCGLDTAGVLVGFLLTFCIACNVVYQIWANATF